MEIGISCVAIILVIAAFFLGRHFASKPIEQNNQKIKQEYETLKKECDDLVELKEKQEKERRKNLDDLDSQLSWKWTELTQLEGEYKLKLDTIRNAKKLADEAADERKKVLEVEFLEYKSKMDDLKTTIQDEIAATQAELDVITATKKAAIVALEKEKQIKESKEQYCLALPKEQERDIPLLRDVQYKISKPRAIAMTIWSAYYQQLAKAKFPKILGAQDVCGIYKITNQLNDACYIGQAVDVRKRWYEHVKAGLGIDTPAGNKLYAAMQEDGIENFSFELLEECRPVDLDAKEKYYIELYQANVFGYNGNKGNG